MIERILWATSNYGMNGKKGLVELRLEDKQIQISVNEAREFAYSIIEAAEAAETDDFLMSYLTEKVGLKEDYSKAKVLQDFRNWRDVKRRSSVKP